MLLKTRVPIMHGDAFLFVGIGRNRPKPLSLGKPGGSSSAI